MFGKLFGGNSEEKKIPQSTLPADGIVVKAVVPINDETKSTVIQLLKHQGILPFNHPSLLTLKELGLRHSYKRAARGQDNYIGVDNIERTSAWYIEEVDKTPDPSRIITLTEKRNGNVFQPKRFLTGGEKATFAMVFEPPCCQDADSVLICFNQGANFAWKIVLSETALEQNVGNYFKQHVHIGRVEDERDLSTIAETVKHLMGIPCDCTVAGKFSGYREPS
jgi:hypothetical protein